jgi:hypothetical protein
MFYKQNNVENIQVNYKGLKLSHDVRNLIVWLIFTLTKTKLEEPHGRSQQTPQKQCKKVRLKK